MPNTTNFDGAIHFSGGDTPNEFLYAANLAAKADVLQALLNEAYVYAREHSQCLALAAPRKAAPINNAAPQLVYSATDLWVPPHATAIVAAIRYGQEELAAVRGFHYLRLNGSVGDIDSSTVEGQTSVGRPSVSQVLPIPIVLDGFVRLPLDDDELATAGVDRESMDIGLYGHSLTDAGPDPVDYYPMSVALFWLSEF